MLALHEAMHVICLGIPTIICMDYQILTLSSSVVPRKEASYLLLPSLPPPQKKKEEEGSEEPIYFAWTTRTCSHCLAKS